jgi:hypothetical protein
MVMVKITKFRINFLLAANLSVNLTWKWEKDHTFCVNIALNT